MENNAINRRDFLSSAVMISAADTPGTGVLSDKAKDGIPQKAGVIGCGGRGSGAIQNFLDAGSDLMIVALGTCLNTLWPHPEKR